MDVAALEQRVKAVEQAVQEDAASRKGIYDRLSALETGLARQDEKYNSIMRELGDQKSQLTTILVKIDTLGQQPGKRWENLVQAAVSAAVGFFFARFGGH